MGKILDYIRGCWANDTLRMVTFAIGIIVCFSIYGMLQEKIMRACYGGQFEDGKCSGKKFEFELTLVMIYCIYYSIFSKSELCSNLKIIFHNLQKNSNLKIIPYCIKICSFSKFLYLR